MPGIGSRLAVCKANTIPAVLLDFEKVQVFILFGFGYNWQWQYIWLCTQELHLVGTEDHIG